MAQRRKTTWTELFGSPIDDAVSAYIRNDFVDEVNEVLRLYGAQMTTTGEIYGSDDAIIFVISERVWDGLKARIRMIDVDAMIRAKL